MTLIERAERAIAELDAHRITHALHAELAELVRLFHADAITTASAPLVIAAPDKAPVVEAAQGIEAEPEDA